MIYGVGLLVLGAFALTMYFGVGLWAEERRKDEHARKMGSKVEGQE